MRGHGWGFLGTCLIVLGLTLGGCAGLRVQRLNQYGIDLARAGKWEEASFYWQQAKEKSPESGAVLSNLAVYHEQKGDLDTARELYLEALKLSERSEIRKNLKALEELEVRRSTAGEEGEE